VVGAPGGRTSRFNPHKTLRPIILRKKIEDAREVERDVGNAATFTRCRSSFGWVFGMSANWWLIRNV